MISSLVDYTQYQKNPSPPHLRGGVGFFYYGEIAGHNMTQGSLC